MADLTITAANVAAAAGATIQRAVADSGVTITAGKSVQIDSNGLGALAKADTIGDANSVGIALNSCGPGQPFDYISGGDLNPGATVAVGTLYVVSAANAGGIAPMADLSTGNLVTLFGIATTASNIALNIWPTGVAHA
jgi:hypothetical protein